MSAVVTEEPNKVSKDAKRLNLCYHNVSRDANASRLPLVFLPTLRSCSSHFLRAFKKNNNKKQKFIIIVKTNMKAFEIIDCTCTVASISSISKFACANVWSVRVLTKSIYVTFVGACEAFVNICQKKNIEKKEKRMKMRFGFYSKVIHVHVYEKSGILVCNFLVSCDSRVGPVSQSPILQFFFHVGEAKII